MSINQFLQEVGKGDQIKDFQHASKLFVGDNFKLAPRQGFLYHVFFDLAPEFSAKFGRNQQVEAGMLVKMVDLPKFTIDAKTLNSYNKPNIVQTKIKYDPINIQFHDDHADVVRGLWFQYFSHFYRDTDLGYQGPDGVINPGYRQNTKYSPRENNNWGYSPKTPNTHPINAVRIYSMSQKRFAEYTLINPIITSFKHGQHTAGSSDALQHEMTLSFETVLYGAGWVSKNTVQGFADIHYDNSPSPLTPAGGGTKSIIGPGGLLDTANDIVSDLGKEGGSASAFFKAFRGYQNLKNTNLAAVAKAELTQLGTDMLRGNNPLNKLFVPNSGNLADGSPIYQYNKNSKGGNGSSGNSPGGATSNGEKVGSPFNMGVAGTVLGGLGASVLLGKGGGLGGIAAVGGLVAGAGALNKLLKVNPKTGAVESVSTLPSKTAAEAQLGSMPNSAANTYMDSYLDSPDAVPGASNVALNDEQAQYDYADADMPTNPALDAVVTPVDGNPFEETTVYPSPENEAAALAADAESRAQDDNLTMGDDNSDSATNQNDSDNWDF